MQAVTLERVAGILKDLHRHIVASLEAFDHRFIVPEAQRGRDNGVGRLGVNRDRQP